MNRPLEYGGYTFFQSGYERIGDRNATILSVSRDPGKWAVYAGFVLVCCGVIVMVASKLLVRSQSLKASAAASDRVKSDSGRAARPGMRTAIPVT